MVSLMSKYIERDCQHLIDKILEDYEEAPKKKLKVEKRAGTANQEDKPNQE